MEKYLSRTEFYVPDQVDLEKAIKRTTHMAVLAHHDDIEIGAIDGVLQAFQKEDKWFFGVVVTDGSGSSRGGNYKNYTNEDMMRVRNLEQKKAAFLGEYGLQAFINAPSSETKDAKNETVVEEIKKMILDAKPEIIYTHNLADKHDTHIGVVTKTIKAIRLIDKSLRPKKLYAVEVWRDLDWLMDDEKVVFSVGHRPNLTNALVEIFDSQIDGAKRYDLATIGRRLANATFSNAHQVDQSDQVVNGMDLTPLIEDDSLDMVEFILAAIDRFKKDVENKIRKMI